MLSENNTTDGLTPLEKYRQAKERLVTPPETNEELTPLEKYRQAKSKVLSPTPLAPQPTPTQPQDKSISPELLKQEELGTTGYQWATPVYESKVEKLDMFGQPVEKLESGYLEGKKAEAERQTVEYEAKQKPIREKAHADVKNLFQEKAQRWIDNPEAFAILNQEDKDTMIAHWRGLAKDIEGGEEAVSTFAQEIERKGESRVHERYLEAEKQNIKLNNPTYTAKDVEWNQIMMSIGEGLSILPEDIKERAELETKMKGLESKKASLENNNQKTLVQSQELNAINQEIYTLDIQLDRFGAKNIDWETGEKIDKAPGQKPSNQIEFEKIYEDSKKEYEDITDKQELYNVYDKKRTAYKFIKNRYDKWNEENADLIETKLALLRAGAFIVPEEYNNPYDERLAKTRGEFQAIAEVYLANKPIESFDKKWYETLGVAFAKGLIPGSEKMAEVLKMQGYTTGRETLDILNKVVNEEGIPTSDKDKENMEWSFADHITDKGGHLAGMYASLMVLGGVTGQVQKGGRAVYQILKSKSLFPKVVSKLIESNKGVNKALGFIYDTAIEEVVFGAVGFEPGTAASLKLANLIPGFKFKSGLIGNIVQPLLNTALKQGVTVTAGMKLGESITVASEALKNNEDVSNKLEEWFGATTSDSKALFATALSNMIVFGLPGMPREVQQRAKQNFERAMEFSRKNGKVENAEIFSDLVKEGERLLAEQEEGKLQEPLDSPEKDFSGLVEQTKGIPITDIEGNVIEPVEGGKKGEPVEGEVTTEHPISVEIGGKETEIPTLLPPITDIEGKTETKEKPKGEMVLEEGEEGYETPEKDITVSDRISPDLFEYNELKESVKTAVKKTKIEVKGKEKERAALLQEAKDNITAFVKKNKPKGMSASEINTISQSIRDATNRTLEKELSKVEESFKKREVENLKEYVKGITTERSGKDRKSKAILDSKGRLYKDTAIEYLEKTNEEISKESEDLDMEQSEIVNNYQDKLINEKEFEEKISENILKQSLLNTLGNLSSKSLKEIKEAKDFIKGGIKILRKKLAEKHLEEAKRISKLVDEAVTQTKLTSKERNIVPEAKLSEIGVESNTSLFKKKVKATGKALSKISNKFGKKWAIGNENFTNLIDRLDLALSRGKDKSTRTIQILSEKVIKSFVDARELQNDLTDILNNKTIEFFGSEKEFKKARKTVYTKVPIEENVLMTTEAKEKYEAEKAIVKSKYDAKLNELRKERDSSKDKEDAKEIFNEKESALKEEREVEYTKLDDIYKKKETRLYNIPVGTAAHMWASWNSKANRPALEKANITEKIYEKIDELLPQEFKDYAEWVRDEFLPSLKEAHQLYEKYTGLKLPELEGYLPLDAKYWSDIGNAIDLNNMSVFKAFTKERVGGEYNILKNDIFDSVEKYINDYSHFSKMAESVSDIHKVMNSKGVKTALSERGRLDFAEQALKHVQDAYRGNSPRPSSSSTDAFFGHKAVNFIRRNFISSKIRANYSLIPKQLTSAMAAFDGSYGNPLELMVEFRKLTKKGYVDNIFNIMLNAHEYKTRGVTSIESLTKGKETFRPDMYGDKAYQKGLGYATTLLVNPTALGDKLGIAIGGLPIIGVEYRNKFNKYITKYPKSVAKEMAVEDATTLFSKYINETQASSNPLYLSEWQKNPIMRNATAFMNSVMSYQRKTVNKFIGVNRAIKSIKADNPNASKIAIAGKIISSKEAWGKLGGALVYTSVLPVLFETARTGGGNWKRLWSEDDDERMDAFIDMAFTSTLGWTKGVIGLGAGFEFIKNTVTGGYKGDQRILTSVNDVYEGIDDIVDFGKAAYDTWTKSREGKELDKDEIFLLEKINEESLKLKEQLTKKSLKAGSTLTGILTGLPSNVFNKIIETQYDDDYYDTNMKSLVRIYGMPKRDIETFAATAARDRLIKYWGVRENKVSSESEKDKADKKIKEAKKSFLEHETKILLENPDKLEKYGKKGKYNDLDYSDRLKVYKSYEKLEYDFKKEIRK